MTLSQTFPLVATALLATLTPAGLPAAPRIEVQGHRGARARLPENTLPAFRHALSVGADWLELDLAVTRDRVLVITHNLRISAALCLGPDGRPLTYEPLVFAMLFSEVRRHDCGALRNPAFPDQVPVPDTPMPTLDELLGWLETDPDPRARAVQLNIEAKIDPENPADTVQPDEFALLIVGLLKRRGMLDRAVVQSFDYRVLREAKRLDASVRVGALTEDENEDLVQTARGLRAETVSPAWRTLDRAKVSALQAIGVKVAPWTANSPVSWEPLTRLGVDSIITDDPAALLAYLRARGLHD